MVDKELIHSLTKNRQPCLLVIGDIMADRYVWGTANRISPEAPVPVLAAKDETVTLGGAANVAQNLYSLNARVMIGGVIGNDVMGNTITQLLKDEKIDAGAVVTDKTRPSTLKTRIIAGTHQLLRVDREVTHDISDTVQTTLIKKLEKKIDAADIVMLSDYNKGVLTHQLTQAIIKACNTKNKKVIIDPKGLRYEKYTGAYLIKPNKRELAEAANVEKIANNADLIVASKKLLTKTKSTYLVVTRSEEGITLISKKAHHNFLVKAKEVYDVTGAGDTVFAALGYFMALGLDIHIACELANYAAAVAVSKVGSVAVTLHEILSIIPPA